MSEICLTAAVLIAAYRFFLLALCLGYLMHIAIFVPQYIMLNLFKLFQKDDLKAVVEYLRADGNVSLIGLWGRSMGAVARLPSTSIFPQVHMWS